MRQEPSETTTSDEPFALVLPGDDGWAAWQYRMVRDRAATLSRHGWKFTQTSGPRGVYYEGHGPAGRRMMGEQKQDPQAALVAAINHAFSIQFPS
jgi:hypothetical protein